MADDTFRTAWSRWPSSTGRKVFFPHGAIIGIDGLVDAGPTLKSVTVTTTKSPASLGLPPESYKVVYEGPAREACVKFPRNVNVHAAIALAGLGFDRTVSRIVADPAVSTNRHLVEVEGTGYQFRIEVSSEAGGKVTGAHATKRPEHAATHLLRQRRPAICVTPPIERRSLVQRSRTQAFPCQRPVQQSAAAARYTMGNPGKPPFF